MPGPKVGLPKLGKKQAMEKNRLPFTAEHLIALFSSPMYAGHKSEVQRSEPGTMLLRDGKFWIPLVGLFSGMRLGEIVQLLNNDVEQVSGIWCFKVQWDGENGTKQVKTVSSLRTVPIHPTLLELGFLEFVKGRKKAGAEARVFSDVEAGADGYFSSLFSKWFSRYMTSIGIKTSKTSFHSLRHNFRDACRNADIPTSLSALLMGHSDDGANPIHDEYGTGETSAKLHQAIRKIEYSIDWSPLMAVAPVIPPGQGTSSGAGIDPVPPLKPPIAPALPSRQTERLNSAKPRMVSEHGNAPCARPSDGPPHGLWTGGDVESKRRLPEFQRSSATSWGFSENP
jgi:hypothetical protein